MSLKGVLIAILPIVVSLANCNYIRNGNEYDFSNVQMHPDCAGMDYCFKRDDAYPEALIEKLLLGVNLTNIDNVTPEHRSEDGETVEPCSPGRSSDPIYQVRDENNKVRYVVQAEKFKQIITVVWCKNKGEIKEKVEPFDIPSISRLGYGVFCEESYTDYQFLALAFDGRSFEKVRVGETSIPVCCRCQLRNKMAGKLYW